MSLRLIHRRRGNKSLHKGGENAEYQWEEGSPGLSRSEVCPRANPSSVVFAQIFLGTVSGMTSGPIFKRQEKPSLLALLPKTLEKVFLHLACG